jgi:hypothetical protein
MARVDGTLARQLQLSEEDGLAVVAGPKPTLRLARARLALRGPDKYRVLEHRRRKAQMAARRILDLLD